MPTKLVIVDGPARGREFPLRDGENVMGRTNETPIELPSNKVSRRHAALHVAGAQVEIEDLGSSNGTFLNGKRVTRSPVPAGAKILVGEYVLQVVNGGAGKQAGAARPVQPQGRGPAPQQQRKGAAMVVAGPGSQRPRQTAGSNPAVVPSEQAKRAADQVVGKIGGLPWRYQVFMVVAAVGIALFLDIAFIVSHASRDYRQLALERAQLIAQQVAAQNAQYMAAKEDLLLNVDVAATQDGVKYVQLVGADTQIAFPATLRGTLQKNRTVGLALKKSDFSVAIDDSAEGPGLYDICAPIRFWNRDKGQFDLVGAAYMVFAPEEVAKKATSAVTLYTISAVLLLAFGAGGSLVLIRTTEPAIARLQEDTELLIRGDLKQVKSSLKMKEVQALAHSINRLSQRAGSAAASPRMTAADMASGMVASQSLALPASAGPVDNAGAAATVRALVSAIEDAVIVVDADSRVVEINAAAERMFGLIPARVRGQHLLEAVTDKQLLNDVLDLLNEIAKAPSGVVTRDMPLPDGEGTVDGHVSAAGVRQGRELAGSAIVFAKHPAAGGGAA